MFRFDDILRKHKEEKEKKEGQPVFIEPEVKKEDQIPQVQEKKEDKPVDIALTLDIEGKNFNNETCRAIYENLFSKVKFIYQPAEASFTDGFIIETSHILDKVIDGLHVATGNFLRLALVDYSNPKEYLIYHAVNVGVLSIYVALDLGYSREELRELGISGLLHDIGMTNYLDIVNNPKKLSPEEYNKIKAHPKEGAEILAKLFKDLNPKIVLAVEQEHEHPDGSGYPLGLKGDGITEYARIIGLVDMYESMTHYRPYREKLTSLETVNTIISNKNYFDSRIIKAMIEKIGIFPLGAFVRLNTKEIAVVLRANPALPLRPVINILTDSFGKELKESKQVDLTEHPVIYIEDCCEPPRK